MMVMRTSVIILIFSLSGAPHLWPLQFFPEHLKELYLFLMHQDCEVGHVGKWEKRQRKLLDLLDEDNFRVDKAIGGPSMFSSCSNLLAI